MLNENGLHEPELTVTLDVDGVDYVLDLQLNRDLIPSNHTIMYQKAGKTVSYTPNRKETQLCQYLGSVRGMKDSWVALSTCHGLRGMIFDGNTTKYIQAGLGSDLESEHFLYDHSHLTAEMPCGYEGGITDNVGFDKEHHDKHEHKFNTRKETEFNRILRYKRSTEQAELRGPYNSNKLSRYVEFVFVVDQEEYKALGENLNSVNRHCRDLANVINLLYSPLNIFIALVGVVVWTEQNEIQVSENSSTTLANFLQYRRKKLITQIANDNAQLLTGKRFEMGVVGKGASGSMCSLRSSGGVSVDYSDLVGRVATTIAHEMGHNFGMKHDTPECECPGERCIMYYSTKSKMHWSKCSMEYLALAFEHDMDYCLRNKPSSLFESPTCGNGFVEPGEQCDCGFGVAASAGACASCCHEDTCMLRHNATCAGGHCCDLKTCQLLNAGTMCRTDDNECDLPEYCTGQSGFCPDDIFRMDTGDCYHGATKMCDNLWCTLMNTLGLSLAGTDPNKDCSGHGVRNSLGHCHCEKGYSPPDCELPGPGGSEDSGPASDPNVIL